MTTYSSRSVPKGAGAGTLNSYNGLRAADYLCRLERLSCHSRPLSWLLIRPPWSNSVSNKMCVYHKMIEKCLDEQAQVREEKKSFCESVDLTTHR